MKSIAMKKLGIFVCQVYGTDNLILGDVAVCKIEYSADIYFNDNNIADGLGGERYKIIKMHNASVSQINDWFYDICDHDKLLKWIVSDDYLYNQTDLDGRDLISLILSL